MIPVMLYFGSFNPPHKGHIAVAEYVLRRELCDEVWLVVSPLSPFKDDSELIDDYLRIQMCVLASEQSEFPHNITVCDIESTLPKPSYTYRSLRVIDKLFPGVEFSILMGADNAVDIEKWKNWEEIIQNHRIYVYPREGADISNLRSEFVYMEDAPVYDISSTHLRQTLSEGGEVSHLIGTKVENYIKKKRLYDYRRTE